jgi:hypothetical protein
MPSPPMPRSFLAPAGESRIPKYRTKEIDLKTSTPINREAKIHIVSSFQR